MSLSKRKKPSARKICTVIAMAVLCVGTQAIAQTSRHVAVHAGHLLDVKIGKLLADQTLVIEDGRIVSVGAAAEAKVPADAVRVELPGATVLPGLIDAHTHLTMDPRFGYDSLSISVPREALTGAKNARLTLLAGFTTVRNVGASGYSDVALRDACPVRDCWSAVRRSASLADTATTTCFPRNITPWAMALPMGLPPCSTRSAKTSSTART